MAFKITNMSDQRGNMAQKVEILENTDEETLKWREVGQDSPWIVKDIKDVDTKCGFAKIITLRWKEKNIRTWGCERQNEQLTTVWAKRETDGAVQIASYRMKKSRGTGYAYHDFYIFLKTV